MIKPVEILKHEHRIIERVLRALDGICLRLENGERVEAETLTQLLDFIRTFADRCHHMKEETHLFPALEQRGIPREGGPIGVMLHEHEVGRELVAELGRAVQAYSTEASEASPRFVQAARGYIDLLTEHIQKEDNILYRMAEDVLDDQAVASLTDAFEQAEKELGAGTHEQFEQVAMRLEQSWAR